MIRLGLAGAGRMGMAVADIAALDETLNVAAIWARHPQRVSGALVGSGTLISDDLPACIEASDVIIDFSLPQGTARLVEALLQRPRPLVCGVSGLGKTELDALRTLARTVPVVCDRNMSLGVAVLTRLVRQAAAALGEGFTVTIDETHHVHKKDAPSGTALMLGEAVAAVRGRSLDELMVYERPARRDVSGQITFHVSREGEVPGDHSVRFATAAETLTLSHSVTTRDVFAHGAVAAARWITDRPAGFYGMQDVLFAGAS